MGWTQFRQAKKRNLKAFELDADRRAAEVLGYSSVDDITAMVDDAEQQILAKTGPVKELEEKPPTVPKPSKAEMMKTAEVIAKIREQKPNLTDEALIELMQKEIEATAGLLSFEAAAVLVADQLGVKLEKKDKAGPVIEIPGKKSQQKTGKPSLKELQELSREAIPEDPRTLAGSGKQPSEHWLPPQLEMELVKEFNRPEDEKTGVALVKYFTPDGQATWYFSEYYPKDDVFYGWCDIGNGFPELGYVSRKELEGLRGKMGLPVERDYYYQPQPMYELSGIGDPKKQQPGVPGEYESLEEKKQRMSLESYPDWLKAIEEQDNKTSLTMLRDHLENQKQFSYYEKRDLDALIDQRIHTLNTGISQMAEAKLLLENLDRHKTRESVEAFVEGLTWATRAQKEELRKYGYEKYNRASPYVDVEPWTSSGKHRYTGKPGPIKQPRSSKKKKQYYKKAMPYSLMYELNTVNQIEVKDGTIRVLGMDPSHVAMTENIIPNRLGIPDGRYTGEIFDTKVPDNLLDDPDSIEYKQMTDGGELIFKKKHKNGEHQARIVLRKGWDDFAEMPEPKINFTAKTKASIKDLAMLLEYDDSEHVFLESYKTPEGKLMARAYVNEIRGGGSLPPVSHGVELGEVTPGQYSEGTDRSIFTKSYLETLIENLEKRGTSNATLEFTTDMPLRLTAEDSEARTEFWLAPCIGVGDLDAQQKGKSDYYNDYYPEDPRVVVSNRGLEKEEWRSRSIPYTAWARVAHTGGEYKIRSDDHRVMLRAINGDNTAVISVETDNILNIPAGVYGGQYGEEGYADTYKYPDQLIYDQEAENIMIKKQGTPTAVLYADPDQEADVPIFEGGEKIGDTWMDSFSKAIKEACKAQKKDAYPSFRLDQEGTDLYLVYQDKKEKQHRVDLHSHVTNNVLDESRQYDPWLFRDLCLVLENIDPSASATIKQNEDGLLVLELDEHGSHITYTVAPRH